MLHRDFMPSSDNTAFEQGECRLNSVRGHAQPALVANVFLFRVIHFFMLPAILRGLEIIELRFVRNNFLSGLVIGFASCFWIAVVFWPKGSKRDSKGRFVSAKTRNPAIGTGV